MPDDEPLKPIPLKLAILDKRSWYDAKAKYYPSKGIATVKKPLSRKKINFIIDSGDIYQHLKGTVRKKWEFVCFVDLNKRKSIAVKDVVKIVKANGSTEIKEADPPQIIEAPSSVSLTNPNESLDLKIANQLDYLTEKAFWDDLRERRKIDYKVIILTFVAGIGGYHLIVLFLRACGINV